MHRLYPRFVTGPGAGGLFLLRAVAGLMFVLHGLGKILNPNGLSLAASAEFAGGFALILGLLTPITALGIASKMFVALARARDNLPLGNPSGHAAIPEWLNNLLVAAQERAWERPAVYLAVMIVLILVGPGAVSFDYLLFGSAKKEVPTQDEKRRATPSLQ
jgi:uncharacterized membrane protein YphA (DoxX/SURF4 family)